MEIGIILTTTVMIGVAFTLFIGYLEGHRDNPKAEKPKELSASESHGLYYIVAQLHYGSTLDNALTQTYTLGSLKQVIKKLNTLESKGDLESYQVFKGERVDIKESDITETRVVTTGRTFGVKS